MTVDFFLGGGNTQTAKMPPHARFCFSGAQSQPTLYRERYDVRVVLSIPMYMQQDATLRSSLYLDTALHVSGGTSTHHQERIQLYVQHLVFVTPV